jgi:hypothetical protein
MKEYFAKYKTLHTHPVNIGLHIVGNLITLLYAGWCIYNFYWLWLLLTPFIIYPFAWTGHLVFEKNTPAAWSNPIKAKISDWIMIKDVFLRKY